MLHSTSPAKDMSPPGNKSSRGSSSKRESSSRCSPEEEKQKPNSPRGGSKSPVFLSPPKVLPETSSSSPNDVRKTLRIMLDKCCKIQDGQLFLKPVDPVKDQCPSYFDYIKKPMDLGSMSTSLEKGKYDKDPWLFLEDFNLMIDNAIKYNWGQSSHFIAELAIRLRDSKADVFDNFMRRLGYCCGILRKFKVRALACYACDTNQCEVRPEEQYWVYDNQYSVCKVCFKEKMDKKTMKITIYKNQDKRDLEQVKEDIPQAFFVNKFNNEIDSQYEPLIKCTKCHKRFHAICVNHVTKHSLFVCHHCHPVPEVTGFSPGFKSSEYSSKSLLETPLSRYLEMKIRQLHDKYRRGDEYIPQIRVRVLSTEYKEFKVKKFMKIFFSENTYKFPEKFPYKSRAIFAFQEQVDKKSEIMLFGLHVNEYPDFSEEPNQRRLYISYLDSVQYFEPKHLRTVTYHEVMLSYIDYMRRSGYQHVSIWSCPPTDNNDYIFYCHPREQKIPNSDILLIWYEQLFDDGISRNIIKNYMDVAQRADVNKKQRVFDYPYLEGDYWPGVIENQLKDLWEKSKKNKAFHQLYDKIDQEVKSQMELEQNVKVFFTLELVPHESHNEPVAELDIELSNPVFDGREPFLTLCRKEFLEFGTKRKAVHSTASIVKMIQEQEIKTSLQFFKDVSHAVKCKTKKCEDPDKRRQRTCLRFKRLMAVKKLNPIMKASLKSLNATTTREGLMKLARLAMIFHVNNCQEQDHDYSCHVLKNHVVKKS